MSECRLVLGRAAGRLGARRAGGERRQVGVAPLAAGGRDLRRAGARARASAPAPTRWPRWAPSARSACRSTSCATASCWCTAAACAGSAEPDGVIDVHNAGTLLRLLPGLLVGQAGGRLHARRRRLDPAPPGGARGRPAARDGRRGRGHRRAARRCTCAPAPRCAASSTALPVASAQVKSCVLLAGLLRRRADHRDRADRRRATTPSACCAPPAPRVDPASGRASRSSPPRRLSPGRDRGARRHLVGRVLHRGRHAAARVALFLRDVGVNPGRTGLLTVLERMGARIGIFNRRTTGGRRAGGRPRGAPRRARRPPRWSPRSCRRWSTSCR